MHKYAYMAWDRNFSYFCDNWRKREFSYPLVGLWCDERLKKIHYMLEDVYVVLLSSIYNNNNNNNNK